MTISDQAIIRDVIAVERARDKIAAAVFALTQVIELPPFNPAMLDIDLLDLENMCKEFLERRATVRDQ